MSAKWPFPITEDASEPKKQTKKQKLQEQQELIQALKFTPRTYRVMLSGYGGEIVLGSVPKETYRYFRDNNIDVEEYANGWNWDEESEDHPEVPEEHRFVEPGSWHDCDNVAHENGCELSDYNYITVTDENGKEHWQSDLGDLNLIKAGVNVEESGEFLCADRSDRENTVGFIGQSVEKGCFFEGELELTAPFDPAKLTITFCDVEGWCLIGSVSYDGVEIEGYDGYDTRGKSMEMKFYDTGEDDANE